MPKATVTVVQSAEYDAGLESYYCLRCGKDTMMLNVYLGQFPRRQTDGAYVVDDEAIKSINVAKGDVRNILRMNRGAERQHRMQCQMCGVAVGYRDRAIDDISNERTYIFPGLLSCNPTISMQSPQASELSVPDCIRTETVDGDKMVTVKVLVTFGSHTLVQVSDVTTKVLVLQLKDSLKDSDMKINEALLQFFMKLLDTEKSNVQMLPSKQESLRRVGLVKVSCGYVYARLLTAMIDMTYILPKVFAHRDEQIAELCGAVGITNPERFTVLGIKTITDLVQVDVVGDLPLLEKRGITYMDMKRLKNAAESMEVSKGPVTVSVPVSAVEGMSPPAEFAEKFASIARGCFCWRIVEQMRPDRKMLEVVLVVTAEFVLVCSLEGSITQVLRCQDVELVAMQEASPCVLAIKAYEKCCEPTLVMSLKPDMRNPVNDTMHPVHALNYIRNRATQDDIQMVRVPTTTHMHVLPCLSGTFTEGEGYMTPQMKFQILQQTKAWPNSGAQTVQSFEFVYTGSDGVSNTLRLGKSSGKDSSGAGKFQWCVDGKLRMADIREVRYEAGELRFRKNDAIMYPSLPEDDAARMQCLKSIAALASRARVRCTGLPKDGRKKKRDEPYTFQDRDGITHKMVQGSKGSIEWWVGAVMHTVTELTHTRGVLQGTPNGPHAHVEAATLPRLQQVATAAGATYTDVPAEKPERCSSVGLQSVASAGSYRHDPYATHDDFDPDRMSPFDGRDTPNAPPSLASSQNPSPVPEEVDMSGLAIMQPGDEAPPAYAPRGFSQRNSQHGGANSPFYNNNTPTPPPPLCTPIATPTAPTPPAAAVAAAACVPGMPPQAGSAPGVVVNFKHGRQGQFPTVVPVAIGEYVVVETMCGLSIGLVVGEAPSLTGAEVLKVLRLALPQEVALWRDLTQKEQTSLPVISDLALRSQTGLQPCRVEFPFDASCLVVHCSRVPTALVLQLSQNFSALLGCRVVINNCRPRQVGEVGDLINEGASPLPVPVRQ